ncbi:hypothetical protein AB0K18_49685 [Nonomuraea sp. NPDC049421]|uniref:hypothetical protein n=1 Tax=Nonomuraea sp. NPDC049421 TaxID=3155275 RepID=UPI0034237362
MTDPHLPDRRAFLRRTGWAVAGALLPATAAETDADPDALFKAGRLAAVEPGYRRRLRKRPRDARAVRHHLRPPDHAPVHPVGEPPSPSFRLKAFGGRCRALVPNPAGGWAGNLEI